MPDRFPYPLYPVNPAGKRIIDGPQGGELYRWRVAHTLNLRDVSAAAGLTPRELGDLEHGRLTTTAEGWGALHGVIAELAMREAMAREGWVSVAEDADG